MLIPVPLALALVGATTALLAMQARDNAAPARPAGPCDILASAAAPCVAAHSTTRALYAAYNGPLYQVLRQSDLKTQDIGVVQPNASSPVPDPGGYANAAAQDAFCANTYCWISIIYDQSPKKNHLIQAPRGGFSGPAMGGFNNLPLAGMAPVTLSGHKVYGVFIAPGMGLRQNDARGTAVDDQAEGQYWVINGHHYNSGCCFDYGNAEIDSRDDGDGAMETTYYGNATAWYRGQSPGPWIMTDQENNLVGCVNESPSDKNCPNLPAINWRFVTATADGEPHHWRALGGDAQKGGLQVMYDGPRIKNDRNSYDPMRKQGAILLGNGGDNSVGSQGTFYEGAMTAAGTFPSRETYEKVQANIIAARYDVPRLGIAPSPSTAAPPGLQTFAPGATQETTLTFTNAASSSSPASNVKLSLAVPKGWSAGPAVTIPGPVAPGASVTATFKVTSGQSPFNGDIVGHSRWTANGREQSETTAQKVRNVPPVKINEFRVHAGSPSNPNDSFIELYNAGSATVDISNWSLDQHANLLPAFSSVKIPAGTKLASKGFYLLGIADSGLAVDAHAGDATIHVRSTAGISAGDTIEIGTGPTKETRKVVSVGSPAGPTTTLWQPLPEGPVMTVPAGSTNVPVTSVAGFEAGQKVAIGYGATYPAVAKSTEKYEIATIKSVGKPGTQAWLTAEAKPGDTNIKVSSTANISVGDKIRMDIDSVGHGIEIVTVKRVGTASARNAFAGPLKESELGEGLELVEPLKFRHSSNLPFSARGTGITFASETNFPHGSNEPVTPLGTGIKLDSPLARNHSIDDAVRDPSASSVGYRGTPAPDLWFGGPALSPVAGAMILRDAAGLVVDSLNYGLLVDPWASEGYQGKSGAGEGGCRVPAPSVTVRGFGPPGAAPPPPVPTPHRSAGRFPDGFDTDSNCTDFLVQPATVLAAESDAGAANIKVASVADFAPGQEVLIGSGENLEKALIAKVGTGGLTTLRASAKAGETAIPVASAFAFRPGQAIVIGAGSTEEAAVVSTIAGFGRAATITVSAPLKMTHDAGARLSGTGITLAAALTKAHSNGTPVATHLPTPGAPNQYVRPK